MVSAKEVAGSLSYTQTMKLFLANFGKLGLDASKFGLHSLRAGGATAAANVDVADHLFKRHGWWRSDSTKDGYVDDSRDAHLSVSKNLKIVIGATYMYFPFFVP